MQSVNRSSEASGTPGTERQGQACTAFPRPMSSEGAALVPSPWQTTGQVVSTAGRSRAEEPMAGEVVRTAGPSRGAAGVIYCSTLSLFQS